MQPSFISSVLSLMLVLGGASGRSRESPPATSLLDQLLAPYRDLNSIYISAHVSYTFAGQPGESTLAFWANDSGYRIDSDVSEKMVRLGFLGSQLQTFDGSETRRLSKQERMLVIKAGEGADSSLSPNPLFLPLLFLDIESAACPFCRPSYFDVRRFETPPPGSLTVAESRGALIIDVPAKPGRGSRTASLETDGNSLWVTEVVLRNEDEQIQERVRFFDFSSVPGTSLVLGRRALFEYFDRQLGLLDDDPRMRMEFNIDAVSAGLDIPEDMFTIPSDSPMAEVVADENLQAFVRVRVCRSSGSRSKLR